MPDPMSSVAAEGGSAIVAAPIDADDLLAVIEPDGRVLYVDPAVRWALGYAPADFAERFGLHLVHPDDEELVQRSWAEALDHPDVEQRVEYRLRTADGTWRWFEMTTADRRDDPGVGAVVVNLRDVTDRRAADGQLRHSEQRFRALVQHSYDALVLSDASNTVTYCSPAITRFFGYEPEEVVGRDGFSFVHPADRQEAIDAAFTLLDRPGDETLLQFRLRARDGSYRWVECTSVNLLGHPHVRAIVNAFRDIHDRRLAEERLRQRDERLEALLANADGAILVVDLDGEVTWASPSAARLWGSPLTSLVGQELIDAVHPDDRREVVRQFRSMAAEPTGSVRVEARMRHATGDWRWYESIFTNQLDHPAVRGIIANVRDSTERALHEQALRDTEHRLEYQATHDPLTDLPNRTLLFDRMGVAIARAERNDGMLAVLFLDLDHFKVVNDSQGHRFGDDLLVAVAERLVGAVRPGDTVARFGGDEFVVLAEDLADEREAVALAERLTEALSRPLGVGSSAEIVLTVSIGITVTDGSGITPDELIRDADAAMYQAKERGRQRAELFDRQMRARAVERHQLETALRRAVSRRQLQVHYQPIVDLSTGLVAGTEALVRWKHPTRGLLHPGTFIAVAEETGLIVPLGAWILDAAIAQAATWQDLLPGQSHLFMAINLSGRQLAETSLSDDIANVLAATPIDPRRVHLEITEDVVMGDVAASQELLERLRVLGVRVAIDDFGTGYSSLSYLGRFPVDMLKIDRSFVEQIDRDPQGLAIVDAIVSLGHTLGLDVVAEGVETVEQLTHLRRLGCDLAQGFLFSPAVPARRLAELLRAGPTW